MTPLLITRPIEQATVFKAGLEARFPGQCAPLLSPILAYEQLYPDIAFDQFDEIVLTSQNGLRGYIALGGPTAVPAYCVGDATASAARAAGLDAVSANGNLADLNDLLATVPSNRKLLYPSGVHVSGEITIPVHRVAVYDQTPQPLSHAAMALLGGDDAVIVPHFSQRSACAFDAAATGRVGAQLTAICISDGVAQVLTDALYARCLVCDVPTGEAMMDKIFEILPQRSA